MKLVISSWNREKEQSCSSLTGQKTAKDGLSCAQHSRISFNNPNSKGKRGGDRETAEVSGRHSEKAELKLNASSELPGT